MEEEEEEEEEGGKNDGRLGKGGMVTWVGEDGRRACEG